MKFNKPMKKALISLVIASGLSHISAAIDEDINGKSGLALKQYAQGFKRQTTELRQQVATFRLIGSEVEVYYKALIAYQAAGDDATAQVAAFAPLFEGYKTKARIAAIRVVEAVCPGDGTAPFLHAEVPVGGDDQPANNTKAAFITWLEGGITKLTIAGATGPKIPPRAINSTHLPKDGDSTEFTRFTKGLKNYIASQVKYDVQDLGFVGVGVGEERKALANFADVSLLKNLDEDCPNMDLKRRIEDAVLYA